MQALILNGANAGTCDALDQAHAVFTAELTAEGWSVESKRLRDVPIAYCQGEFACCVVTPGICKIHDAAQDIARAYVQSDLVILLTPVTFGGYASELKKALDRFAFPILSPFFTSIGGETHHPRRYRHYPRLVALGLQEHQDAQSASIFRSLVARNALTLHAPAHAVGTIPGGIEPVALRNVVHGLLESVARHRNARTRLVSESNELLPDPPEDAVVPLAPPHRALLLVGSAKQVPSLSEALGTYLLEHLQQRQVATETLFLHRSVFSGRGRRALVEAVDRADLVVLAFPIYVDSPPFLVIRTLELIADHRRTQSQRAMPSLLCLTNCGLPEVTHTRLAVAICRRFASEAGFNWAGGLALGGGQAIGPSLLSSNSRSVPPLHQAGPAAIPAMRALDLLAAALAEGKPAPEDAIALMGRQLAPSWVYRLLGSLGWYREAWQRGTLRRLWDRPYEATSTQEAPASP